MPGRRFSANPSGAPERKGISRAAGGSEAAEDGQWWEVGTPSASHSRPVVGSGDTFGNPPSGGGGKCRAPSGGAQRRVPSQGCSGEGAKWGLDDDAERGVNLHTDRHWRIQTR